MIELVHPRTQMAIGGLLITSSIFVCSYITSYYTFVIVYAVIIGMGFGLLYMPALRNAW